MAASQQLVHRWNERLAVGERLLTNPSPRLRWLGRMYVRLYRFLLSVYGTGEWRSDTASPQGEDEFLDADGSANRMPFVDLTSHDPGAPAKSIDTIRATLKRVHAANPEHESGTMTGKLRPFDWVVVAAESGLVEPGKCVKFLFRHGIEAIATVRGADVQVEVKRLDFERAMTLIANNKAYIRTPSRSLWRTKAPVVVLGMSVLLSIAIPGVLLLGVSIYFSFASFPPNYWPYLVLVWIVLFGLQLWFMNKMQHRSEALRRKFLRQLAEEKSRNPWSNDDR